MLYSEQSALLGGQAYFEGGRCHPVPPLDTPLGLRQREWRGANCSVWLAKRASWKIWFLADIRAALTNQELALVVTCLWRSERRRKSETTMRTKSSRSGYPELYDTSSYFYRTGIKRILLGRKRVRRSDNLVSCKKRSLLNLSYIYIFYGWKIWTAGWPFQYRDPSSTQPWCCNWCSMWSGIVMLENARSSLKETTSGWEHMLF